jgi:6-phosphogluconolactonase (cycloisomerase 2 family)
MRIYTAPGVIGYTIHANKLNTNLNLKKGSYSTVVQAADKCGGVGKKTVNITVSKINLFPPKFLYTTEYMAGKVAGYRVNPLTGSITPTSQGAAWAHWGPVDIASDYWGNHLYVANAGSHDLSGYSIDRTTGNLTNLPGSPYSLVGTGRRVAVHPSGKFIYVTSDKLKGGNFGINGFAIQSNGSLKPVPGSPFASSEMLQGAIAVTAKYLYVAVRGTSRGQIGAYSIDPISGALTPLAGSPFLMTPAPNCQCSIVPDDLTTNTKGTFLYANIRGSNDDDVAGYAIDQNTGTLTRLQGSPYSEGATYKHLGPVAAGVDPSGKFVYTADFYSSGFSVFRRDVNSGVLTYVNSFFNMNGGVCDPETLSIDPSGTFLYNLGLVLNQCQPPLTRAVVGFSINQGNGTLLPVPGSPVANSNAGSPIGLEKVLVTR